MTNQKGFLKIKLKLYYKSYTYCCSPFLPLFFFFFYVTLCIHFLNNNCLTLMDLHTILESNRNCFLFFSFKNIIWKGAKTLFKKSFYCFYNNKVIHLQTYKDCSEHEMHFTKKSSIPMLNSFSFNYWPQSNFK